MMKKVTFDEINRIRQCNSRIRNENHLLRCTLRNLRADPFGECSKVLSTVIQHCTKKKGEPKSGAPDCPCCPVCPPAPCCYPRVRKCSQSPKRKSLRSSSCSRPLQTSCRPCTFCCCPECPRKIPSCPKPQPRGKNVSKQGPTKLARSHSPGVHSSNSSGCCQPYTSLKSRCSSVSPSQKYCTSLASSLKRPSKCGCVLCRPFTLDRKDYCSNHEGDGRPSLYNHNKIQDLSTSCAETRRPLHTDCRGDGYAWNSSRSSYTSKHADSQSGDTPCSYSSKSDAHARFSSKPSYASNHSDSNSESSPYSWPNVLLKTSSKAYPTQKDNWKLSQMCKPVLGMCMCMNERLLCINALGR